MLTINSEIRKEYGKSASRRLRLTNKLPSIVYGGTEIPTGIILDHNIILNLHTKKEFYSDILSLIINDKVIKVMVKAIQYHPYKLKLTHIDFIRIK